LIAGTVVALWAQTPGVDRFTVPLSDPARPATVKVSLIAGDINVKGYAGKEVIVEARARNEEESHRESKPETQGLKRIPNMTTGLTVEEEDNIITISTGAIQRPVDVTLQVPLRTSLRLKSVNDGDIKVEQVQGEIEVGNINGSVTLQQVSGSVVANAHNEDLKVTLTSVEPNKAMSFTSFNGDVDVTLPADVKATLAMKSDQGEIFSDFDIKIEAAAGKPVTETVKEKGARFRVQMDKTVRGTINGGGPEFQFKTFNGGIYIRKAAASPK
jgi:hypothetical protein